MSDKESVFGAVQLLCNSGRVTTRPELVCSGVVWSGLLDVVYGGLKMMMNSTPSGTHVECNHKLPKWKTILPVSYT